MLVRGFLYLTGGFSWAVLAAALVYDTRLVAPCGDAFYPWVFFMTTETRGFRGGDTRGSGDGRAAPGGRRYGGGRPDGRSDGGRSSDGRGGGGFGNRSPMGERRGGERSGDSARRPSSHRNVDISTQVYTGTVKWLDFTRGFGFIKPDMPEASGNDGDLFVHISCLSADLLALLRDLYADGRPFTDVTVQCQKATPRPAAIGQQSGRGSSDKPYAVNVVLASSAEEGESEDYSEADEDDDFDN